jgi:hypothetical protein
MTTLKSTEINNFIIANHTTMTSIEIAEKYGMLTTRIASRKSYLNKKGLLSNVIKRVTKLGDAYVDATKLTIKDKKQIQAYIIANHTKFDNAQIAKKLDLPFSTIRANYASLKRFDRLGGIVVTKPLENSFGNSKGLNKQRARVKMVNPIETSGVTGTILTLSHIACTLEKMVMSVTKGNNFLSCETDRVTYNGMRRTIRDGNLPFATHFGSISDKIYGVAENTYAHLLLDYCGMITTFAKEVQYAINNDIIKVGGTMSITFNKRGCSDTDNFIKRLAGTTHNNTNDKRGEMERGVEAYFNKIIGWNYELVEIFNYSDVKVSGVKGAPMMVVIIKRIK